MVFRKHKVLCFYSSLVLIDKALISQVLTLIQAFGRSWAIMLMHQSKLRHRIFGHARNKEGQILNSGWTKEIVRQITPLHLEGTPPPADQ